MTPTPTADDALRALTEALNDFCEVAEVLYENTAELDEPPFRLSLLNAARAALALAARVRTWRRMAEEQPKDGQLCLTWPGRLGQVMVEAWKPGILSGFRRENVTHWLPLPPPPEAAPHA